MRDTPTLLVTGFNSPEGPAFDRDGNLWFVNWLTSSINRLDGCEPGGTVTEVVNTGGIPAGLAFHPDGTLYIADEGDQWHGVLKYTPGGTLSAWVQTYQGHKLNGANDLVFANDGTLYFSDPWRSSLENPIGGSTAPFRTDDLSSWIPAWPSPTVSPSHPMDRRSTWPRRVRTGSSAMRSDVMARLDPGPSSPFLRNRRVRMAWRLMKPETSTLPTTTDPASTSLIPKDARPTTCPSPAQVSRTSHSVARIGGPW